MICLHEAWKSTNNNTIGILMTESEKEDKEIEFLEWIIPEEEAMIENLERPEIIMPSVKGSEGVLRENSGEGSWKKPGIITQKVEEKWQWALL